MHNGFFIHFFKIENKNKIYELQYFTVFYKEITKKIITLAEN